jgi:predicted nucleic acid-binding protein
VTIATEATVYLDTSVFVATIVPAVPHHSACVAFCDSLAGGSAKVITSDLMRIEFVQSWFRLPSMSYLDAQTRRDYRMSAWDRNVAVRERWMAEGVARMEALLARFHTTAELPLTLAIWRASVDIMARHRLRSYDAVHVATALLAGVQDFATVDDDFRRVPTLRLNLLRDSLI